MRVESMDFCTASPYTTSLSDSMILFQVFKSLKNQIWWYGQAYQNMQQSKEYSSEPMLSRDFSFCEFYFLILFFLLNTEMDQFEVDLFDFESYR